MRDVNNFLTKEEIQKLKELLIEAYPMLKAQKELSVIRIEVINTMDFYERFNIQLIPYYKNDNLSDKIVFNYYYGEKDIDELYLILESKILIQKIQNKLNRKNYIKLNDLVKTL